MKYNMELHSGSADVICQSCKSWLSVRKTSEEPGIIPSGVSKCHNCDCEITVSYDMVIVCKINSFK